MNAPKTRTDLDVCLELFECPPARDAAIDRLAATFPPNGLLAPLTRTSTSETALTDKPTDRRRDIGERWRDRTLDGTPVEVAMPTALEVEAVGLAGWAMDREHRGERNQGVVRWVWAAGVAYRRRQVVLEAA